jgi:hypothetical protein
MVMHQPQNSKNLQVIVGHGGGQEGAGKKWKKGKAVKKVAAVAFIMYHWSS